MTSAWKQQNDSNMTSTVFEFECSSKKQEHDSMTAATWRWQQQQEQEQQQQRETNQFDTRYSHPKTCRACRLHSSRPILRLNDDTSPNLVTGHTIIGAKLSLVVLLESIVRCMTDRRLLSYAHKLCRRIIRPLFVRWTHNYELRENITRSRITRENMEAMCVLTLRFPCQERGPLTSEIRVFHLQFSVS